MVKIKTLIIWIILNILILVTGQLSAYLQVNKEFVEKSFLYKVLLTEFFASFQWIFVIIYMRLSYTFLTPVEISLYSYITSFIGQILSNKFLVDQETTFYDYISILLILIGAYITSTKVFG